MADQCAFLTQSRVRNNVSPHRALSYCPAIPTSQVRAIMAGLSANRLDVVLEVTARMSEREKDDARDSDEIAQSCLAAIEGGRSATAAALVQAGLITEGGRCKPGGMTWLELGMFRGDVDMVAAFVQKGLPPTMLPLEQMHAAALVNDMDKVQSFLDAGVDINGVTNGGGQLLSALEWAALGGAVDVVEWLLAQPGIDVNAGSLGPVFEAVRGGRPHMVRLLLADGRARTVSTMWGTILHYVGKAPNECAEELVDIILDSGLVDVNAVDELGRSALHLAVEMGRMNLVRRLLQHPGICRRARNAFGETVLNVAIRRDHLDMVALLTGCV